MKRYIALTKPGIVRANVMTAVAGFLFASQKNIDWFALLAMAVGLGAIIAAACVCNNYIDRDIDTVMSRTKKRALVTGEISTQNALIFASLLLSIGAYLLGIYTTWLALLTALIGVVIYVGVYGYFKRKTVFSTEIGSVAGAVPPVVGYTAVTGRMDIAALSLFMLLVIWQMPHFYAIGIFRFNDYKKAKIPILPVVRGLDVTKKRILIYIALFMLTVPGLWFAGYAGLSYLIIIESLSVTWFVRSLAGYETKDTPSWAGKMFGFSLVVLTALSIMLSINAWIP